MSLQKVFEYVDNNSDRFIDELALLVRQPSVSARSEGMQQCAQMVQQMMEKIGLSTQIIPEEHGNPVVFGEIESQKSEKTLLFYNHYDVQPPEPLEEWKFGPFSGKVKDGTIYGRGVADNKGNLVSRLKVVEAFLKTSGDVPVNVKFIVEGEEEIGSPHLEPVIKTHKGILSADAAIWEFGGTDRKGRPLVHLGLKGVLSVELRTTGALRDVHSANAPLVQNAAWRLVWALDAIKDERGKVLIEGFYDRVEPPSSDEVKTLSRIPFDEEAQKKDLGLGEFLHGLTGRKALRALLYEPTCTINGLLSGYTGLGSKTVLPNKAMAKLDFRLVPRQMPDEIISKLKQHLEKKGFNDIEVVKHGSTEPTKTPLKEKFVRTVVKAAEKVYDKKAVIYPTSAASGPMHLFRNQLGYPVVSVGCVQAESNTHAPNENLSLESFIKGTKFMATVIHEFAGAR